MVNQAVHRFLPGDDLSFYKSKDPEIQSLKMACEEADLTTWIDVIMIRGLVEGSMQPNNPVIQVQREIDLS